MRQNAVLPYLTLFDFQLPILAKHKTENSVGVTCLYNKELCIRAGSGGAYCFM